MTGLPARGERVTIVWPNGPYDFEIQFERVKTDVPAAPGWVTLYGLVVQPADGQHGWQSFYVHLVDGQWSLLPKLDWTPVGGVG